MNLTNSTTRILLVRRENIGDLILTTPLIRLLREQLPDAHIAALVNSYNAPVLEHNADLDEVFVYTKGKHADSWWGSVLARLALVRLFFKLRRMRFDDVILAEPTYTPRNIRLARFIIAKSWSSPARRVIGFEHDDGEHTGLDVVVSKAAMEGLHQAQIMLRIASAYGIAAPSGSVVDFPPCRVGRPKPPAVVGLTNPLRIGLHLSARKPSQRWPVESFAALAGQIQQAGAVKFSVFWSPGATDNALHPGDDEKAQVLKTLLAGTPIDVDFVQTHDLATLIRRLDGVDLLICADGGAMHIAAGLGKPIVALFGDSEPIRWRPWGVPHRLLQAASHDVADLSVDEVSAAFDELAAECGFQGKIRTAKIEI
ncbi:MAG: glycosyltransferase family 9 protein [Burkholderiales bacterium]|jgi:heptosyltransferase-3|nr:glycosyltransferase family 9 protein [Betaproteobacteria bacterium]